MIKAGTDLTKRLFKPPLDRESFCEVLLSHYNRSNGSAEELNFGDQDSPSIHIRWGSNGQIKAVTAANDLDEDDIAKLEAAIEEVLQPAKTEYRRFPLFSNRPVSGAIGFEDWFQILPAPAAAPQPTNGWGDHVSVLEVCVEGSSLPMLVGRRAFREARVIELLLSALTVGGFRLQSRSSKSVWVLDPNDEWKPKHLQKGYSSPDIAGSVANFTDIDSLNEIELVDVNGYFDGRSQGSSDAAILPSTFPYLAIKFNSFDATRKNKFLRASHWMLHMNDVWGISRSAAYIAAISAIESLVPPAVSLPTECPSCGAKKAEGMTQRFADFVDSMVKDAVPRKQRLAFYNRRSRIVHGQMIARNDDLDLDNVDPTRLSEDNEQRWLTAITRIVLHNWLVDQEVKKSAT